jgi:hypothetical protein
LTISGTPDHSNRSGADHLLELISVILKIGRFGARRLAHLFLLYYVLALLPQRLDLSEITLRRLNDKPAQLFVCNSALINGYIESSAGSEQSFISAFFQTYPRPRLRQSFNKGR